MKKSLLPLCLLASAALSAHAFVEPMSYEYQSFQHISPNGQWIMSEIEGSIVITNLVSGESWEYNPSEDLSISYSGSNGNSVSDNGIVCGSTSSISNAAYWQNGEWKSLPLGNANTEPGVMHLANGVTPDGSRICGSVGAHKFSMEDAVMLVPAYWDVQADGSFAEPVLLPHPDKDFSGRVPQYITANAISRDGKVIVGQVVDYSGFLPQPIVYTQNADGEWSYRLLASELINPEGLVFPEYPGEAPEAPSIESYLTEEELDAYNDAVTYYWNHMQDSVPPTYPQYADYMNPDSIAAYNAAMDVYTPIAEEWQNNYNAFEDVFNAVQSVAPAFRFNSTYLTPSGSKYVTVVVKTVEDPNSWFGWAENPYAASIDLATGECTVYEDVTMDVSCVPNENTILGVDKLGWDFPTVGYIMQDGKVDTISTWLGNQNPELKAWMVENMTHEYENWIPNEETGDYDCVLEPFLFCGMPLASEDLNTIAVWTPTLWDMNIQYLGYVFKMDNYAGVQGIGVNKGSLSGDDIASVAIYNLAGACVVPASANALQAQLPAGIYIAKAIRKDGSAFATKLVK